MKTLQSIPVAIALGLAVGSADAALPTGTTLGETSTLLLVLTDNSSGANFGATYIRDLGISYADIVNGTVTNFTWDFSADANFANFVGRDLSYFAVASYALDFENLTNFDATGTLAPFTDTVPWGVITTSNKPEKLNPTYDALYQASQFKVPELIINSGKQLGTNTSVSVPRDPAKGSFFGNFIGVIGSSGLTPDNSDIVLNASDNGSVDLTVYRLIFATTNDPTNDPTLGSRRDLGSLVFSNQGQVALTSAPVPVPPAIWLMGSALAGLIGYRRKVA